MKIGLISDTHGDIKAWQELSTFLRELDLVVHAGDVLYHGIFNPILESYKPLLLAEEINRFPVPLYISRGNCDSDVDQLALNYPLASPYLLLRLEELTLLVHHGHIFSEKELLELAKKWKVNLVVSGHTHSYRLKKENGVLLVNPGSPSLPKENKPPTIAILKKGLVKIIRLKDGAVLEEASLF